MSNILKKAINVKIVSAVIAAILAAAIAVGILCGFAGFGVFNKDALLKDSNTLTVSVNKFVYSTALDKVESECESVLSKYGIAYEMKGEMSGDVSEIVYVFDKGVDLEEVKTALETKFAELTKADGALEGAKLMAAVNSEAAIGILAKGYVVRGVIAGVVLVALVFAYVAIRYGLFMGITAGVSTALGTLLTAALIILTRIPVTASVIYVIAVSAMLTAVMSVVALNKIRENEGEEVAIATNEIGALTVLMGAALVVIGAVATNGVRWFAILAVVALIAAAFIGLVFTPAMYVPFKVAKDNKPVEGAYVGAVKTSTREKKVFPKKEKPAKEVPVEAPVEEAPIEEEAPVEVEETEAVAEEIVEEPAEAEETAEEIVEEEPVIEEAPVEAEVAEVTEEVTEAPAEEAVEAPVEETTEAPVEETEEKTEA